MGRMFLFRAKVSCSVIVPFSSMFSRRAMSSLSRSVP